MFEVFYFHLYKRSFTELAIFSIIKTLFHFKHKSKCIDCRLKENQLKFMKAFLHSLHVMFQLILIRSLKRFVLLQNQLEHLLLNIVKLVKWSWLGKSYLIVCLSVCLSQGLSCVASCPSVCNELNNDQYLWVEYLAGIILLDQFKKTI